MSPCATRFGFDHVVPSKCANSNVFLSTHDTPKPLPSATTYGVTVECPYGSGTGVTDIATGGFALPRATAPRKASAASQPLARFRRLHLQRVVHAIEVIEQSCHRRDLHDLALVVVLPQSGEERIIDTVRID